MSTICSLDGIRLGVLYYTSEDAQAAADVFNHELAEQQRPFTAARSSK
jgi:hypothetical protein